MQMQMLGRITFIWNDSFDNGFVSVAGRSVHVVHTAAYLLGGNLVWRFRQLGEHIMYLGWIPWSRINLLDSDKV